MVTFHPINIHMLNNLVYTNAYMLIMLHPEFIANRSRCIASYYCIDVRLKISSSHPSVQLQLARPLHFSNVSGVFLSISSCVLCDLITGQISFRTTEQHNATYLQGRVLRNTSYLSISTPLSGLYRCFINIYTLYYYYIIYTDPDNQDGPGFLIGSMFLFALATE